MLQAQTSRVIHYFNRKVGGVNPKGLNCDPAGNIFGTTNAGGVYGQGVVFKVDSTTHLVTVLHNFTGAPDGAYPFAPVILDPAGNLYGTTSNGGDYGIGAVFNLCVFYSKRRVVLMATFSDRFVLAVVATLTVFALSAQCELEDPIMWITQYEHDAAAADLTGDTSFYQRNLADDWSDGMSNGQFQSKNALISDLTDKTRNITFHEDLSDIKVRVYGNTAVATYTEQYDARMDGKRVAKTIITTDTFAKIGGRWKLVAAHSSAVAEDLRAKLVGTWELASTVYYMADGSKQSYPDVGPNGKGYLVYTGDGHMCAAGMNPDRPAWKDANKPTDAEKLRAIDGFFGYCGRYEIDAPNHVIYHFPEVALEPGFVGTKQRRPYNLDGETLTFADKEEMIPGVKGYSISWKKTK